MRVDTILGPFPHESSGRLLRARPSASALLGQSGTEVGAGAPNEHIRILFTSAYFRGSFSRIAGDPTGPVRRFGTTGLIQEFTDSTRISGRLALVKASSLSNADDPYGDVYQITTDMYAYYSTVGSGTAGYPIQDTRDCPAASCVYQTFDKPVALFSYVSGSNEPQNITLRDAFLCKVGSPGRDLRPGTRNHR